MGICAPSDPFYWHSKQRSAPPEDEPDILSLAIYPSLKAERQWLITNYPSIKAYPPEPSTTPKDCSQS